MLYREGVIARLHPHEMSVLKPYSVPGFEILEDARLLAGTWEFKMTSITPAIAVELDCAIERASGTLNGNWFTKTDANHTITLMGRGSELSGYALGRGVHRALFIVFHGEIAELFPEYPLIDLRPQSNLKDLALHAAAGKIRSAVRNGGGLLVESLCCELTTLLLERYGYRTLRHVAGRLRLSRTQLSAVLEHIEEHGFTKESEINRVSIRSLAQVTHLSSHHFLSAFKSSLGVTPHQFILRKRIQRARRLLAATEMPMLQVADQCGFCSQSHFANQFKSATGVTPMHYRREIRSATRMQEP